MSLLPDALFDLHTIAWLQRLIGLGHPLPFQLLSQLGETWGMIFVVGLAFWMDGRRTGYALVLMLVVATASWYGLNNLFDVPRPEGPGILVYDRPDVGAFPSGHVYHTVATWGLLYALGHVPLAVPLGFALLVGLARLYLGAHWPGDVLSALLIAPLLVAAYARSWPRVRSWLERRRFRTYLILAALVLAACGVWLTRVDGSPRRWQVIGMVIGAALALPAGAWLDAFRPPAAAGRRLLRIAAGLAGIAACALLARAVGTDLWLHAVAAAAAVIWAVLVMPLLFRSGSDRGPT